jgi:hypothetical protein
MTTIVKVYPTKDAEIANHSKSNWYIMQDGISTGGAIGCWDWPSGPNAQPYAGWYGYQGRMFFQYGTLPTLPPGAVVVKATFKVPMWSRGKSLSTYNNAYYQENANPTINVHRVINSWEEGLGNGENVQYWQQNYGVNWTKRSSSRFWNSYGGDFEVTPAASKVIPYQNQEVDFDITDLYKKWVNKTVPNEGVVVKFKDDHLAQGAFSIYTREYGTSGNMSAVPYIEVEYNEPPEPPRALQPNNQSTMSPQLGLTRLDWEFVDYEPAFAPGKMDLVFMLDGSSSFYDDLDGFKKKIKLYLDRLDAAKIDYRAILFDYRGQYDTHYVASRSKNVSWTEQGYSVYVYSCSNKKWAHSYVSDNSDLGRTRYYSDGEGYSGTISGSAVYGKPTFKGGSCSVNGSTTSETVYHTVTFSGTVSTSGYNYKTYRGGGIINSGWQTNRQTFQQQIEGFTSNAGAYQPTWEVFLKTGTGVKATTFRSDAEVNIIYVTDTGLINTYNDKIQEIVNWATTGKYKVWSLSNTYYINQFTSITQPTGGESLDLSLEWHALLPLAKAVQVAGNVESGDTQSRADVRIWRVEANNTRTFLKTLTATTLTHVNIVPTAIPLENNKVYEWEVTVYDSSNLPATSQKALFTYRNDLTPWMTPIDWGPLPQAGDVVKRSDLVSLKEALVTLGTRLMNVNLSTLNSLFTGDIVPSKADTNILRNTIIQMMVDSNMDVGKWWTRDFVNDGLLDPDDIQYIRTLIDLIHSQGPSAPGEVTATKVQNYVSPPATFTAVNSGMYSSLYTFNWASALKQGSGWRIQTTPSPSRDILLYRLLYNYKASTKKVDPKYPTVLKDSSQSFYTYYDYTIQQFEDGGFSIVTPTDPGEIFIQGDGPTAFDEMKVRAIDMSGHSSADSIVKFTTGVDLADMGNVQYYKIEYQVRDIAAVQSDPLGKWDLFGTYLTGNAVSLSLKTTGTVWFRICAVTTKGLRTDYTYTSVPVHARL